MKKEDIKEGVFLFKMVHRTVSFGVDVVRCVGNVTEVLNENNFRFFVETWEGNIVKIGNLDCIHPSELIGGKYRKEEFEIRVGSQEFRNLILALKNKKK